jgi:thiamine biosynthesis lipoprotein
VSKELFAVLERAREVSERSAGAFDITCGPLVRLWREARTTGAMPSEEAIANARKLVGWKHLVLDKRARTAEISLAGVKLDLGGIAKGYACDEAIAALKKNGVDRAKVSAGGDMAFSGPPPNESGWLVTIRGFAGSPKRYSNCALSTSGDTEQSVEIGGKRYSHIVDPRTGIGVVNRVQASVIAPKGLTSDPLATAICVLGKQEGEKLAKRYRAQVIVAVAPSGDGLN